jgi:hypothetical protein
MTPDLITLPPSATISKAAIEIGRRKFASTAPTSFVDELDKLGFRVLTID